MESNQLKVVFILEIDIVNRLSASITSFCLMDCCVSLWIEFKLIGLASIDVTTHNSLILMHTVEPGGLHDWVDMFNSVRITDLSLQNYHVNTFQLFSLYPGNNCLLHTTTLFCKMYQTHKFQSYLSLLNSTCICNIGFQQIYWIFEIRSLNTNSKPFRWIICLIIQ